MGKNLSKTYDPKDFEERIYKMWEENVKIINFRYPYVLLLYGQAKLFRRLAGLPPEILRKERRVRKVQPVGNLLNG